MPVARILAIMAIAAASISTAACSTVEEPTQQSFRFARPGGGYSVPPATTSSTVRSSFGAPVGF